MKLWGAVFGGLFGFAGFSEFGLVSGALLGLLAGVWAESAVRRLARDTYRDVLDAELDEIVARRVAAELDARGAAPPAPEPVREAPAASVPRVRAAARTVAPPPAVSQPLPERAMAETIELPTRSYEPPEPDLIERGFAAARNWLLGGNTIVRVGLVILFVGLSFLANYAANAGLFPIELRLATVGAVGAALLGVGFNRRVQRPEFGLALQGAGVGVLYLTVFAAARVFEVLPPLAAFALMIVIAALGCALALLQDSKLMALASFAGGFAVPVLLGGESPTPLPLFTYGTILNVAILFIARWKSWRELNLLGFFATFIIGGAWAAARYGPEQFWICQLFLAATVAIYLLTALLYAHNTPGRFGLAADSTLLFGTAIVGFGFQTQLVADLPYGEAWAALAFGAVYVALAAWVWRTPRPETRLLGECLIAIGVGFVTLAIPLALEVRWAGAAWALEGAGAFWVGMRQARWMPRAFGIGLVGVAAMLMLVTIEPNISALPLLNTGFIGPLLIAGPLLAIAWWLRRPLEHSGSSWAKSFAPYEARFEQRLYLAGFTFACVALVREVTRQLPAVTTELGPVPVFPGEMQQLLVALAVTAAMWLSLKVAKRLDWAVAGWPALFSLPLLSVTLLVQAAAGNHVFDWPDVLPWLAALALHIDIVRTRDALPVGAQGEVHGFAQDWIHAGTVWLLTGVLANTLFLGIARADLWNTSWAGVAFLVAATLVLLLLTRIGEAAQAGKALAQRWPLAGRIIAYAWTAAVPLVLLVYGGALMTAVAAEGVTAPLPYIPLLNPVDLSVLLALAALALWHRMASAMTPAPDGADMLRGPLAPALAALLGFAAINAVWLRTAHHWLGVGWDPASLAASGVVQTGISILWTLLAMALMVFAQRRALRTLWLVGAALLALVVAKLLLVDMSSAEGWQRIVTFIAVGILMLVIGYFVPLPPRKEETRP